MWTAEWTGINSDGSLVCGYVVETSGPNPEDFVRVGLGIANADGSNFRWLETGTVLPAEAPKFTPDDVHVLFSGYDAAAPTFVGGVTATDIYMMKADGTEAPVNLTNTPTVIEANPLMQ